MQEDRKFRKAQGGAQVAGAHTIKALPKRLESRKGR